MWLHLLVKWIPWILNQQDSEQTEVELEPGLSQQLRDIGCLIKPNMSVEEVCSSISQISKGEKYAYLNNHVQPPSVLRSTFLMATTENLT